MYGLYQCGPLSASMLVCRSVSRWVRRAAILLVSTYTYIVLRCEEECRHAFHLHIYTLLFTSQNYICIYVYIYIHILSGIFVYICIHICMHCKSNIFPGIMVQIPAPTTRRGPRNSLGRPSPETAFCGRWIRASSASSWARPRRGWDVEMDGSTQENRDIDLDLNLDIDVDYRYRYSCHN